MEAIYGLQESHGLARTSALASRMKVALGTVTNVVRKLESRGLVTREAYRGVKLTDEGRRIAIGVLRKRRLAERLLTDILRVESSEAREAASKLGPAIPDEVVKPIEKALNEKFGRFNPQSSMKQDFHTQVESV
ncbi:MAG: metal-dependent transcriptional regulator [Candidatus Brockarchaeota archaeon]|nr:metal-dependent transcriptional regulator [Candidatus Brockarchaeota archaeon]